MIAIQENLSLASHSTMRLGGPAKFACYIHDETELLEAVAWAEKNNTPIRTIGSGSNIVWSDEGFEGLVIINQISGFEILDDEIVVIGAGEEWDKVVSRTTEAGLSGIEFLSWIPGTTGATPVQNVGAYGHEISEVLQSVRAYDTKIKNFIELSATDCQFGYRTSRFKTIDSGRFIISTITLKLSKNPPKSPFYESLQEYLDENDITNFTAADIRNGVIEVRKKKLPDPDIVANNGSFFANPIIAIEEFEILKTEYPEIVNWKIDEKNVKISAAWLIEKSGFKDFHDAETGMATWEKQPLVLINENAKSTADLLVFKQKIVSAVQSRFGIALEQEPEMLP